MSRIGSKPISLPNGVDASVNDRVVSVKGPKGSLTVALHPAVTATVHPAGHEGATERVIAVSVNKPDVVAERALWGLSRQLIANAVAGVQKPYEKSLEFVGVGYKVSMAGKNVHMDLGFSHPIDYPLPEGIEGKTEKQILTISGIDKKMVGEVSAQIRRLRPPEPYKGKGIKYTDEVIRRKAGKTAKTAA
jgi:large subunit ribosomal protein L6